MLNKAVAIDGIRIIYTEGPRTSLSIAGTFDVAAQVSQGLAIGTPAVILGRGPKWIITGENELLASTSTAGFINLGGIRAQISSEDGEILFCSTGIQASAILVKQIALIWHILVRAVLLTISPLVPDNLIGFIEHLCCAPGLVIGGFRSCTLCVRLSFVHKREHALFLLVSPTST